MSYNYTTDKKIRQSTILVYFIISISEFVRILDKIKFFPTNFTISHLAWVLLKLIKKKFFVTYLSGCCFFLVSISGTYLNGILLCSRMLFLITL